MECILLFWMAGGHTLVYVFCSLGMFCMILLWIGRSFAFLSSTSQRSLSLQDECARAAGDSGGITLLLAVAKALV